MSDKGNDLISRCKLFNALAPVQTLGEAYGVIQGMETEDAVSVKWIESRIQRYQDQNDAYSVMAAAILRTMIGEWKDETD